MEIKMPFIYIIILNWNGWKDTIECLESVFRLDYPNYKVIVCDNDSQDGSLEKIKQWAEGKIDFKLSDQSPVPLTDRLPIAKPLKYVEYDRTQAENGGRDKEDKGASLILIQIGANLGFAGGNNVGLKYALKKDDFSYIWLLNNDTVVKPDALYFLINRVKESSQIGICGSTLLYYNKPNLVQAYGGAKYNHWLGIVKHIGYKTEFNKSISQESIEKKLDYIVGASMLVSKEFLTKVGLMNESYFLYYEELDWAIRAQNYFKLAYASYSIVYHKEGSSIGSCSDPRHKSQLSDYYGLKNKLVFTKRFYPSALPTIYLSLLISIIIRLKRRQFDRIFMILEIILRKNDRLVEK